MLGNVGAQPEDFLLPRVEVAIGALQSFSAKRRKRSGLISIRDDPSTTTTMFELISRDPVFHFWGNPGCRTKCSFYTVEHRESTKILHLMCHFDGTSDAKRFLGKIMVVVVFGPSLIQKTLIFFFLGVLIFLGLL